MDSALPIVTSMGDFPWPDNQSLASDEDVHDMNLNSTSDAMDMVWESTDGMAHIQGRQLSPASTSLELQMDSSLAPTMAQSVASSCEESWGSGNVDREDVDNDIRWEQGSDDVLTAFKAEPREDLLNFNDLKSAPLTPAAPIDPPAEPPAEAANPQVKQKRPRGRPRKHPIAPPVTAANKVTKGRSKTGCITCRKRKKKCDEAKPRCMNCEKNAVVCEGYHEKQIWKSGKEKAEEEDRLRRDSLPSITLHPLFHGVETTEDKIFWKHYINKFSNVLTIEGEAKNAFKDIILHLANRRQGLMHSILSVSSKHIDYDAPDGIKILQDNPTTSRQALEKRSDHHHDEAMKRFHEDFANSVEQSDPEYQTEEYQTILCARYGQILCRLLQTRVEGNASGEHRLHLQAFQTLIEHSPPQDATFYAFITEFFQFHIYSDDLLWHPDMRVKRLSSSNWEPAAPIQFPRLIGVADGLLQYMAIITDLRNSIRDNITASHDPPVDYVMLFRAAEINSAVQEWTPQWGPADSRSRVGLLYKQMMFIYLFRTIYPPSTSSLSSASSSGHSSMSSSESSTPQRRASMATSIVSTTSAPVVGSSQGLQGINLPHSCPSSRNPSRNSSMHEGDASSSQATSVDVSRASSPPPKRRPALDDPRLIGAVDESLAILETFDASEPAQALLLIPCLMVGVACFDFDRRQRVRKAIQAVRGYTGLRNTDRVVELLEEVWGLMDEGDWFSVWDWQAVAKRFAIDIPCT